MDSRCKYFDDNGIERRNGCFSKRDGRECRFAHPDDRERWANARPYEDRRPGGDRGGARGRGRGGGGWSDRSTYVDRDGGALSSQNNYDQDNTRNRKTAGSAGANANTSSAGGWGAPESATSSWGAPSAGDKGASNKVTSSGWAAAVDAAPSSGWVGAVDSAGGWGISNKDNGGWCSTSSETSGAVLSASIDTASSPTAQLSTAVASKWPSSSVDAIGGSGWGISKGTESGRGTSKGTESGWGNANNGDSNWVQVNQDGGRGSSKDNESVWGAVNDKTSSWGQVNQEGRRGLASNSGWESSNMNGTWSSSTATKGNIQSTQDAQSPAEPSSAGPSRRDSSSGEQSARRRASTSGSFGTGTNLSTNDSGWAQRHARTQQQSSRSPETPWPRTSDSGSTRPVPPINQPHTHDDQPPARIRHVEPSTSGAMSPPTHVLGRHGRDERLSQWFDDQNQELYVPNGGSRPVREETFSSIFEKPPTEAGPGGFAGQSESHRRMSVPVSSTGGSSYLQELEQAHDYFELFEKAVLAKQEWEEAVDADKAARRYVHSQRFSKASVNATARLDRHRAETVKRVAQAKRHFDRFADALAKLPEPEPLMQEELSKLELQELEIDEVLYMGYLQATQVWLDDRRDTVRETISDFDVLSRPRATAHELAMLGQIAQKVESIRFNLVQIEGEAPFEDLQDQLANRADALAAEFSRGEDEELAARLDALHIIQEAQKKETSIAIGQDGVASRLNEQEKKDEEARNAIIDFHKALVPRFDQWILDIRDVQSQLSVFTEQAQQLEDDIHKLSVRLQEIKNPEWQANQYADDLAPLILGWIQPYLDAIRTTTAQTLDAQEDSLKLKVQQVMTPAWRLVEACHSHLKTRGIFDATKSS